MAATTMPTLLLGGDSGSTPTRPSQRGRTRSRFLVSAASPSGAHFCTLRTATSPGLSIRQQRSFTPQSSPHSEPDKEEHMSTVETITASTADTTRLRVLPHWIDGAERVSSSGRTAPCSIRRPERWPPVSPLPTSPKSTKPSPQRSADTPCGAATRSPAADGAVRVPRAAQRAQDRTGAHHHRRARQGCFGRDGRDPPRPGSGRTGNGLPAPDQGRVQRKRLDGRRCLFAQAAARRGGSHLAVQLPCDGADVVLPHRHRRRQRRDPQAQRERSVRRALACATVEGSRATRRCVHRPAGRQARRG